MASEVGSNIIKNYRAIRRTIYDPRKDDLIPTTLPCQNCREKCRVVIPTIQVFLYPDGDPRIKKNGARFEKHTSYWCFDCVRAATIENDKRQTNISVSD